MIDTLLYLEKLIHERRGANPDTSYIAKRLTQGKEKIAQKMGEEAVETIIAAMKSDKSELISESADMLFHWLLLIADAGIGVEDVAAELKRREGNSGLDEKARRKMKE